MSESDATHGLAALAKPIQKLVEVCAAGVSGLYAPVGIRRRARAEADAMLILEEAKNRRSDIALRGVHRMLEVEERRQMNIEAVVEQAKLALPDEVSSAPVDTDWSARFFRHVEDVGNERMQLLWGKLLAGEVAAPGTFSPRTLRILSDLTTREAGLFEAFASQRLLVLGSREPFLFYGANDEAFQELGISWSVIQELDAAGLIHDHALAGVQLIPGPEMHQFEAAGGVLFVLTTDTPRKVSLGRATLTRTGAELSQLAGWIWKESHMRRCVEGWRSEGWHVEAKTIVRRNQDGSVEVDDRIMPF